MNATGSSGPATPEERAESFHAGDGLIEGEFCDLVIAFEQAIKDAYLSGYKAGFYAAGNWFPDESWERYRKRIGA